MTQSKLSSYRRTEQGQSESYQPSEHQIELTKKQKNIVASFGDVAEKCANDGKPVTGIAAVRLKEYVKELILLRRHRNKALIEYRDRKTTDALNNSITNILRDLKRQVPHHPVYCDEDRWSKLGVTPYEKKTKEDIDTDSDELEILDPGKREYDWKRWEL